MSDILEKMYVLTPITNTPLNGGLDGFGYRARAENYWQFKSVCDEAQVKLVTIEGRLGERAFEVTERDNPLHVQLTTIDEIWHKENLLQIGLNHVMQIDPDAKYICWIDSDTFPLAASPRAWFEKTFHALQNYEIVQMWEYLQNFGPDRQPIYGVQMSFMKTYAAAGFQVTKGKNVQHTLAGNSGMVSLGRSGLAWAANVSALNKIGGFAGIERCILGSGDWHLAHALVGGMEKHSMEMKLSSYSEYLLNLQELCERHIRRDVGFVPVSVGHWYHGDKAGRKYDSRGRLLLDANYNPYRDVKPDSQGMLQLETWTPEQMRLRDLIRDYFETRNEDSVPLRD